MAKRSSDDSNDQISQKYMKKDPSFDRINCFLAWCMEKSLSVCNKVKVDTEGSCAHYGMIATEDIANGECLFEIPRSLLLMPETSGIAQLLADESSRLQSKSGWVPLLVALMHEYTSPKSLWRPYLDLVPDFNELDPPMFWTKEERDRELRGTGLCESVQRDEVSVSHEFNSIVLPFVDKHQEHFTAECRDLLFYKRMVAFVMAYSFTEPPPDDQSDSEDESRDENDDKTPPMMVPMADILNHVAEHNAHLDFGKDSLKMVAVKDIKKGDEVYNTYGELSNAQLLHMYGFAEAYPLNTYDVVEIGMSSVHKYISSHNMIPDFDLKWNALKEKGIVTDDGAFVLGAEGILTEDELSETLRVCSMNKEEVEEFKTDEWTEEETSLLNDDISELPETWRRLLVHITSERLKEYPKTLKEEEVAKQSSISSPRSRFAFHVRYGQQKILENFLVLCSNEES